MTTEFNDETFLDFLFDKAIYTKISFACSLMQYGKIFRIPKIEAYCLICEQYRTFKTTRNLSSGGAGSSESANVSGMKFTELEEFRFKCMSCDQQIKSYFLYCSFDSGKLDIQKVGEYPRKEFEKEKELEKFFKEDKENYRKAEICLAHEFGVAAFAYLRRIIETNIKRLIELIQNDPNNTEETLDKLNKLHKASRMSENIEVANNALPSFLLQNGINPLGQIYKILSEGVHSLTDEECLRRAKVVKACTLFLVKELTERDKNMKKFQRDIANLAQF